MIDLHCHILPGLDDGPATLDESLDMCRMAAQDGIRTIVATPHFCPGRYEPSGEQILASLDELQQAVDDRGIAIRLVPGSDVMVTPELPTTLKCQPHLTINMTGTYFLAEFPHAAVPPGWEVFLRSFLVAGQVPIITHPERHPWFASHPDALEPFIRSGGMVQITAMSILGKAGIAARDCSLYLLQRNMVHVIASDAHSAAGRTPVISSAVRMAATVVGASRAHDMVMRHPRAILEGKRQVLPEPEPRKGGRRWLRRVLTKV